MPAVRPVTVSVTAPAEASVPCVVQLCPPAGRYSATNDVSSDEASVQVSVTEVEDAAWATRPVGADGGIVRDTEELADDPCVLVATTRNS